MHSEHSIPLVLILISTLFVRCTLAGLNVLSSITNGEIFSFSRNPHVQYLSGGQVSHFLSVSTPRFTSQPTDDLLHHLEYDALTLSPSTSVWLSGSRTITPKILGEIFKAYKEKDDVWNDNFLENLFLYSESDVSKGKDRIELHPETYAYVKSLGVSRLFVSDSVHTPASTMFSKDPALIPTYRIVSSKLKAPIAPGPFVFSASSASKKAWFSKRRELHIHNVYRLYLDEYDAFLFGAIPDLVNGGYMPTNITSSLLSSSSSLDDNTHEHDVETQLIPVPSRLSSIFSSSKALPFTGLRFGLKDIFDARGLPTAAGSLAYALTHPTPNTTSPSLTPLLHSAITIIGKTRTSQFAHGAHPWEYVDFAYSYNPRGDGYMTAAASSSGSAVAVAGYEWLDGSVGSDTRGSVRRPASLVGVYGIRPSWGKWLDMKTGVVQLSEEMDTAGFFVRDPELFVEVATRWYGFNSVLLHQSDTTMLDDLNLNLIYPTEHFPLPSLSAQRLVDDFVASLNSHLNIYPAYTNLTHTLAPFFPNGRFSEFQETANTLAEYRSWIDVGEPTTQKFFELFDKEPVFDPVPQRLFEKVKKGEVMEQMFRRAVEVRRGFQDNMEVFFYGGKISEEEERNGAGMRQCGRSTLFVYHTGTGARPSYRVEDLNYVQGSVPFSMNLAEGGGGPRTSDFFHLVASMGGLPEVTIPLGEVDYWSQISRRWEPIPVSVQVVGARGCDALLVDLVRILAGKGVLGKVGVGRSMYY